MTMSIGQFQPTPPARTETAILNWYAPLRIFQPTPPARTETETERRRGPLSQFQPTPPARTETDASQAYKDRVPISTHSAREDGDSPFKNVVAFTTISTHSAREDGDYP